MKVLIIRDYVNWNKVISSAQAWQKIREDIDKYKNVILDWDWIETTCSVVLNNIFYWYTIDKIKKTIRFKNCNKYIENLLKEYLYNLT